MTDGNQDGDATGRGNVSSFCVELMEGFVGDATGGNQLSEGASHFPALEVHDMTNPLFENRGVCTATASAFF